MSNKAWWEARRFKYNKGLVIAGVLAFFVYCVVAEIVLFPRIPQFEITLFTMAFQGIAYLFMMLVANVLYSLGPAADSLLNVHDDERFRERLYNIGYWFSFALPFMGPVIAFITTIGEPLLPGPQ